MARTLFSSLIAIAIFMTFSTQVYATGIQPNVLGIYESQVDILGMQQDEHNFKKLVEKASGHVLVEPKVKLGDILYYGNDLIRDEELAVYYWKEASSGSTFQKQWVAKANFRLGKYYFNTDRKQSELHLRKASRLGHNEAAMMLFIIKKQKIAENKEGQNA